MRSAPRRVGIERIAVALIASAIGATLLVSVLGGVGVSSQVAVGISVVVALAATLVFAPRLPASLNGMDSAESLAMLLSLAGHEVQVAHDGLEAVEAATTYQPNVILPDAHMVKPVDFAALSELLAESTAE